MYHYFFVTSMEERDGIKKNTLRALPNQVFPDGTPVNPALNINSPKDASDCPTGNRLSYPEGTFFTCDHLELRDKTANGVPCAPYYSIYNSEETTFGGKSIPNFYPVSMDPNFVYADKAHRNESLNKAFAIFQLDGSQEDYDESESLTAAIRLSPVDENGYARPFEPNWKETYEDQIEVDKSLFQNWVKNIMIEEGVKAAPIRMDKYANTFSKLHAAGETIDSIANRARFEKLMNALGLSYANFNIIKPHEWYLGELYKEHECLERGSAMPRDIDNDIQLKEAASILCSLMNERSAVQSQSTNKTALDDLKKALKMGWTLDDCVEPKVLCKANSWPALAKALADGTIALNKPTYLTSGMSMLDALKTDPKYLKPSVDDGFVIDDTTWNMLLAQVYGHVNTILVGPTGTGKTELIITMCKKLGLEYTLIQMGGISDVYEHLVLGKDLANNGTETVDIWSPFALAIQKPGVVILDEVNRIPKNGTNALFNVLDNMRELAAPTAKDPAKKVIKVHPECTIFATANLGSGYTGTKQLDQAFENRFTPIEVGYLKSDQESTLLRNRWGIPSADAKNIVFIANKIRDCAAKSELERAISTRETLDCARLVNFGFSCKEAMEARFLPLFDEGNNGVDDTSERAKVRNIISQRFATSKS